MVLNLNKIEFEISEQVKLITDAREANYLNEYFNHTLVDLARINDQHLFTYYYVEKNHPASYGRFSLLNHIACLDNVVTLEDFRGKGIEKALCKKMLMNAKREAQITAYLQPAKWVILYIYLLDIKR